MNQSKKLKLVFKCFETNGYFFASLLKLQTNRFMENLEGPVKEGRFLATDRKHRRWISRRGGSAPLWAGSSRCYLTPPF